MALCGIAMFAAKYMADFYMNSSVYDEVRSRESSRLIWTGTVLK